MLIRDGKPDQRLMKKERITLDDIDSSLREKGIEGMHRVRIGYLEDTGQISALLRQGPSNEKQQSAADTRRKEERSRKKRGVGEI